MTIADRLALIEAAIQIDPGNRGLGRVPGNNLFTACAGDLAAACASITNTPDAVLDVLTGFLIATANPPAYETDGPPGCAFLARALASLCIPVRIHAPLPCLRAIQATFEPVHGYSIRQTGGSYPMLSRARDLHRPATHRISVEHPGPAADGRCYSMSGRDSTHTITAAVADWFPSTNGASVRRIGIGDGGNELGMGKIDHAVVAANIPLGDRIHCRMPADHLIVAGVSNWGAYALVAGIFVLREVDPPPDLFNSTREKEHLHRMVEAGPLVDGVTGHSTATVDGLTSADYSAVIDRIGQIVRGELA